MQSLVVMETAYARLGFMLNQTPLILHALRVLQGPTAPLLVLLARARVRLVPLDTTWTKSQALLHALHAQQVATALRPVL